MDNTLETILATATPGKLVAMLYKRAIQDLRNATELFDLEGDPKSKADAVRLILHAQQIINELNKSINEKCNIDLASNMKRIYEYMQYRLTEAIAKQDKNPINEIIGLLVELCEAWETIINPINNAKGD